MGFGEAIASGFGKYATFSGRAPRSEYWWWFLFVLLASFTVGVAGGILDVATGHQSLGGLLGGLLDLFFLLPNLAIAVRRLHDRNISGWWYAGAFITLLLLIGMAVPVFIRIDENHMQGLPPMEGVPSASFLVMGVLGLINLIYGLTLFILFCLPGTRGANRFGPDPLRSF